MKLLFYISIFILSFSSCRKIEIVVPSEYELIGDGIQPDADPVGMYLVNEGNMGSNKCTLDYLDFVNGYYIRNLYSERNPDVVKELGDVGNDIQIYGSKLLASNENGIGASNHVEIVETARKIYGATPGNYDPKTATPNKPYESDDDMTRVNITPPTGLTDNRTFIISLAAIVLVVVVGEIYFIKKKVLK